MSILKTLSTIVVCLSMAFLTGCEDEDVAVGAGLVAIGAIAVAIDKKPVRRVHRRGRRHRRGRIIHRSHRRGHRRGHLYSTGLNLPLVAPIVDVEKVSASFNMNYDNAVVFVDALEAAQEGDASNLFDLGVTEDDLLALSNKRLPGSDSVARIAANLDQDAADTRTMFKALIQGAEVQYKNINSYVWKSCMADGHWKTPENSICKNVAWKGCSPVSGASACLPANLDEAI